MLKINRPGSAFWRKFFTRLAIIAATVTIIVWFLPRNQKMQLRYDIGKPWMYGSFIAKFDFPIYKTDEAIKAEKDSLLRTFQPYYNYNPIVEQKEIAKFKENYKDGLPGLPDDYMHEIKEQQNSI